MLLVPMFVFVLLLNGCVNTNLYEPEGFAKWVDLNMPPEITCVPRAKLAISHLKRHGWLCGMKVRPNWGQPFDHAYVVCQKGNQMVEILDD